MSKPDQFLDLSKRQLDELSRYYRATYAQHPGHPIVSGIVPVPGVPDIIQMSYCIKCKKVIGTCLANDNQRKALLAPANPS